MRRKNGYNALYLFLAVDRHALRRKHTSVRTAYRADLYKSVVVYKGYDKSDPVDMCVKQKPRLIACVFDMSDNVSEIVNVAVVRVAFKHRQRNFGRTFFIARNTVSTAQTVQHTVNIHCHLSFIA